MKIEALICLVLNINLDCSHTGYSTVKTTLRNHFFEGRVNDRPLFVSYTTRQSMPCCLKSLRPLIITLFH